MLYTRFNFLRGLPVAGSAPVRPLAHHLSLRERIVARLRLAILAGDLAPKARLREPELARQLEVSRTPLREAIRQLEAEGLLTTIPRIGTFVSELTAQDAEELYALRVVIEGLAARQAAERPDPAKGEILRGILEELAKRTDDFRGYHEISGQFHDAIAALSGNRRLQAIYQGLAQHVSRMRILSNAVRGRPGISLRGHRQIAAAIIGGRGAEAERLMRMHIEGALRVLRTRVRADASDGGRRNTDRRAV
jgi:DNA-binding GntR family transcriptional regulator